MALVLLEIHKRFLTAGVPGFRSLYATQGTWLDSVKRRFRPQLPLASESSPVFRVPRTCVESELSALFNRVYLSRFRDQPQLCCISEVKLDAAMQHQA
jgi:hypothetical protein